MIKIEFVLVLSIVKFLNKPELLFVIGEFFSLLLCLSLLTIHYFLKGFYRNE